MLRAPLALLVGTAGCNLLLGLDETRELHDARPEGPCTPTTGHDEDGDGVTDDCDLCPHLADPGQLDGDGDAVGDACDPTASDDQIVLFDAFEVDSAGWTPVRGNWQHAGDAFVQADPMVPSSLAVRTLALPDEVAIDTTFRLGSITPAAEAAVGLWFYATVDVGEPEAYCCQLVRTPDGLVYVRLERWAANTATVLAYEAFPGTFLLDDRVHLRAERRVTDALALYCTATEGDVVVGVKMADDIYQNGTIGLRTAVSAGIIEHVVVIAPR